MINHGKIMGIDYGDVRIGIAISDSEQNVAFGKTSINNTSINEAIEKISEICDNENVVEIVVGLPLSLEGKKTEQTKKIEQFTNKLKESIQIPVLFHDERLTTRESNVILTSLGIHGKKKVETKKREKDIISASIILQNYLNLKGKKEEKKVGET